MAAGAIAEKYLRLTCGTEIVAFVSGVGPVELSGAQVRQLLPTVTREQVDAQMVRCPIAEYAERMTEVRACPTLCLCVY